VAMWIATSIVPASTEADEEMSETTSGATSEEVVIESIQLSKAWADGFAVPIPTAKPNSISGTVGPLLHSTGTLIGQGTASYYARSFEGGRTACGGVFRHSDPSVAAVSVSRSAVWPCGTRLTLSGPAGVLMVVRSDSCGGCGPNDVDLSEAGFVRVCGSLAVGRCRIEIHQGG
jgi:hypothetical protein